MSTAKERLLDAAERLVAERDGHSPDPDDLVAMLVGLLTAPVPAPNGLSR